MEWHKSDVIVASTIKKLSDKMNKYFKEWEDARCARRYKCMSVFQDKKTGKFTAILVWAHGPV